MRMFKIKSCIFALVFSLICAFSASASNTARLTLLYTTDTHGHIATDNRTIGLDVIAAVKNSLPGSLLLDAGDFLHGTPLATLSQGKDVISLMKEAGYDAAAAGNHEFAYGQDVLRERVAEADAPPRLSILSANVHTQDGSLLFAPSLETNMDGVNVCIFGLTTPGTVNQASPSTVIGLEFADLVSTARDMERKLRDARCDLVVALTHVGSDSQIPVKSTDIARQVPGLDLVIDGHSHVMLEKRTEQGTLVVSSGAHGKRLGRLDIEFDTDARKVMGITNTLLSRDDIKDVRPDPTLAARIAALEARQDAALSEVVGQSSLTLNGESHVVRTRETNLGDLCADALRSAYGADLAIANGGSLRASIGQGPVTRKDVMTTLAFGGYAVNFAVTGRELLDILEYGFGKLPGAAGAFPQISGFTVRVKADNPPGSRVLAVTLPGDRPLDMQQTYTLTVNDFLAEGGDGYPHFAAKSRGEAFMPIRELFARFLHERGTSGYPDTPSRIMYVTQ